MDADSALAPNFIRYSPGLANTCQQGDRLSGRRRLVIVLAIIAAGFAAWAAFAAGHNLVQVGDAALHALWLIPFLVGFNLFQLWLSARAWQSLLQTYPIPAGLFSLRIIREGIDSLLPVAQIGGEAVGAQLLARQGPPLAVSVASVVVDVTLEFISQLMFLLLGLVTLAATSPVHTWRSWIWITLLSGATLLGFGVAQRIGLLRMIEGLAKQVAARWPAAASLVGLEGAAAAIYRRRGALLQGSGFHLIAWMLGTVESWALMHALGWSIGPFEAFVVESLGMAARSAGFAIPGAMVVQETGFTLAAMAIGLPEEAGLFLSLLKRVREVSVGVIGLLIWHFHH